MRREKRSIQERAIGALRSGGPDERLAAIVQGIAKRSLEGTAANAAAAALGAKAGPIAERGWEIAQSLSPG